MKMDYKNKITINAESDRIHAGTVCGDTFCVFKNNKRLATILSTDEGIVIMENKNGDVGTVLLINDKEQE